MTHCVWLTVLMDVEDVARLEWPAGRRPLMTLPGVVRVYGAEVSLADATAEPDLKSAGRLQDHAEEP